MGNVIAANVGKRASVGGVGSVKSAGSAAGSAGSAESVGGEDGEDCDSQFLLLCCPSRDLSFGPWPFRLLDFPALAEPEEPLLVSNCLALADSQWLRQRPAQRPARMADVRRLAPLVRLTKGTRLFRTRGEIEACGTYRVLGPRPELLFLVEFQYDCLEDADDASGGSERRHAPSWRREVRPPAVVKHPVLDETLLARCVVCTNWSKLTSISLAGRGIKVLGELPVLPCVSDLDLSYNQLGSLGSLYAFPNLRNLNLAFNNFVTLVNMRDLPALESLDLSWNSIRQLIVILRCLFNHAAGLRCLQVCHNPVGDVLEAAHCRHLAARYLPKLAVLDGEPLPRGPGATVFLEPPHATHQATQISTMPPRPHPADELRLRWRADRGDRQETVLQPDRHTLCARGRGLSHVLDPRTLPGPVSWLTATRWADLSDNLLGETGLSQALAAMPHLLQLSLAKNTIETVTCLQHCPMLQRLDVSGNYLQSIMLPGRSLQHLTFLDLSCNLLQSLVGLEELTGLQELYLANNCVRLLKDLQPLKRLQDLCSLDLTGNEVSEDPNFKKFVVFHLRRLKTVNGQEVVDGDLVAARETFGGCLDGDVMLTRYAWKDLTHLAELHLPNADLRQVDLPGQLLPHLEVLDLSHNHLCHLWGLHQLPRLSVLDLGHNKVLSLRNSVAGVARGAVRDVADGDGEVFPALATLYLDHNGLTSLRPLSLGSLRALQTLFLQNNQLQTLDDLGHAGLRGVVLDSNHLGGAALSGAAAAGLLHGLANLHLDSNHVDGLAFLRGARSIRRLFISKNKIADESELECLRMATELRELTLLGNPVCLRPRHYAQVKELLPQLELFDGHSMDPERYLPYPAAMLAHGATADEPKDAAST